MDAVTQTVVDRLLNYNKAASGGKSMPPTQRGSFQIPPVSNFRVLQTQQQAGGTVFTLAWVDVQEDASQPVDHYNIFVSRYLNNNQSQVGPYMVKASPANIFVPADAQTPVVFSIQSVTPLGLASPLSSSASTTSLAQAPLIQEDNLAFSLLQGFQVQPLASATIHMETISTTTTVLNVSPTDGGVLLAVGFQLLDALVGHNTTTTITITSDGSTPQVYTVVPADSSTGWASALRSIASQTSGSGTGAGDTLMLYFSLGFQTSIQIQVTTAADGTPSPAQRLSCTAWYANKVSS